MAIAHDATSTHTNTANSTGESFSHTCTGSDLTLVATLFVFSTVSNSASAITYNGVSMTLRAENNYNYTANRYLHTLVYTLDNPATGSNTFSVTYSTACVANAIVLSSYTGANNGIGATNSATGTSSSPSVTLTTNNATGLIVGGVQVLGGDSDPFTPGSGVTERSDGATDTNTNTDVGFTTGDKAATGGSDTFNFTASVSDQWSIVAVEINEAAGGTEGTLSATLGAATLAATGELAIDGTISATLGTATLSSAGTIGLSASLDATLEDASLSATGTVAISGVVDTTLGDATLSSAGAVAITGAVDSNLDDATLTASGTAQQTTSGTLTATLADATVSATGELYITGELASTLANATVTAVGSLLVSGTADVTLGDATADAAGGLAISGTAGATLESASLSSTGALTITGTLSATLGAATLAASGTQNIGDSVVRYVVLAGEFDTAVALVGEFDTAVSLAGEFQKTITLAGEL